MGFQIQLLGAFKIFRKEDQIPIPVRSYAKIYSLIALQGEAGLSRRQMIQLLWPLDDPGVANGRLRVALSAIRKELKEALIESGDTLSFAPSEFTIDFLEMRALADALQDELDDQQILAKIPDLLPILRQKMLPGFSDDWAEKSQTEWSAIALKLLNRFDRVATETKKPSLVADIAAVAFEHSPYSDHHWQSLLRASATLGTTDSTIQAFKAARQKAKQDGIDPFSPETTALLAEIKVGGAANPLELKTAQSERESKFLAATLLKVIETNPELAMQVFDGDDFHEIVFFYPDVALNILKKLIEENPSGTPHYLRAKFSLMYGYHAIELPQPAIKIGLEILKDAQDPELIARVNSKLGVAYCILQDFETAIKHSNIAKEIFLSLDQPIRAIGELFLEGSCHYHSLTYDRAIELWTEVSRRGRAEDQPNRNHVFGHVAHCNCGIARLIEGKEEEALPYLTEGMKFLEEKRAIAVAQLGYCAFGYLKYSLFSDAKELQLVSDGIVASFKGSHIRAQQIGALYVGMVLAKEKKFGLSLAVLDYLDQWRLDTIGPLSPAETSFALRARALCAGHQAATVFNAETTRKDYLQRLIRELRFLINKA